MKQKNNMKVLANTITKNKQKLEKIKSVRRARTKFLAIMVVFILLVILMIKGLSLLVAFFRLNTFVFQSPITVKFNQPVELVSLVELERRQNEIKVIDEISNEVIQQYLNPKQSVGNDCKVSSQINPKTFFTTIRNYESSNGKNTNPVALHNYCKSKGMWNEIGYNPQDKYCFKDQQEAELYVAYYVKKKCDNMPLANCLCLWNTGKATEQCAYSDGLLSFAN